MWETFWWVKKSVDEWKHVWWVKTCNDQRKNVQCIKTSKEMLTFWSVKKCVDQWKKVLISEKMFWSTCVHLINIFFTARYMFSPIKKKHVLLWSRWPRSRPWTPSPLAYRRVLWIFHWFSKKYLYIQRFYKHIYGFNCFFFCENPSNMDDNLLGIHENQLTINETPWKWMKKQRKLIKFHDDLWTSK